MRNLIILSIVILLSNNLVAQQDAMFTHYSFNTLAVNPAYAGTRDALTVTGLHRSQWVSFDGAPLTQTITLHSPIFRENIGVGLSLLNDKIGPLNTTSLVIDLSYKIKVSKSTKLSFGLKGGGNLMQGDLSSLELDQQGDQAFSSNVKSNFLPNFGAGLYLYNPKWYIGLSAPRFLENNFNSNVASAVEKRHYFFIAGLVARISNNLKFRPTTYLKVTEAAPIEADLTGLFIIADKFELGGMFRTGDAVGALLGYNFNSQLRVGYSFDWSYVNKTGVYNGGSHEVMLRYDIINKEKKKIRSPRYF